MVCRGQPSAFSIGEPASRIEQGLVRHFLNLDSVSMTWRGGDKQEHQVNCSLITYHVSDHRFNRTAFSGFRPENLSADFNRGLARQDKEETGVSPWLA
jgi:hypothetical protein